MDRLETAPKKHPKMAIFWEFLAKIWYLNGGQDFKFIVGDASWQGPTKFFAAYEQKISTGPCLQNLRMIFRMIAIAKKIVSNMQYINQMNFVGRNHFKKHYNLLHMTLYR